MAVRRKAGAKNAYFADDRALLRDAKKLHLSVMRIETHRARIKEKLGLRDWARLTPDATCQAPRA